MQRRSANTIHILPPVVLAFGLMITGLAAANDEARDSAHDPHAHHRQMVQAMQEQEADDGAVHIPDATLTTQNREQVRLATDVVGDRIVVMDFVYTTCTTVCPVLSAIFSQVEKGLGDRLGSEIVLVSLTVDPLRDTPDQLKAYAQKFGAGENWFWLTGGKQTMDSVLRELGAYTPNFEDHPSMVLVGDSRTGEWSRFVGFPGANQIMNKVNELSAARTAQQ